VQGHDLERIRRRNPVAALRNNFVTALSMAVA
jgi:hypothetical protein